MEITKNVCQEDAELILTSINSQLVRDIEIYEKWPKITIQKTGYEEYSKYMQTDITVEFIVNDETHKVKVLMSGFVLTQFDDIKVSFKDFDPDAFTCEPHNTILKNLLFPLAKKAVRKKKGDLLAEAENWRKIEKLLKM